MISDLTILAGILVAVFAFFWFLDRLSRRRLVPVFSPNNDLEHLLLASVGDEGITNEMLEQLSSAVLFALESDDVPYVPRTFSAFFPADFAKTLEGADALEGNNVTEDGKIQYGPWVVCFSSADIVQVLAADPIMNFLVTKLGKVREFPSREVFQSALDGQFDVVLNPFVGVTRRFTQDEIRQILASS